MLLSLLISMAFAADTQAATSADEAPVFEVLEHSTDKKTPLGGSFEQGEKNLRAANPEAEAVHVFGHHGLTKVVVCGFACLAPGVDAKEFAGAEGPTIPATSDAQSAKTKGYNEAAMDYATRFNKKMVALKSGGEPAPGAAAPINREFSSKELTVNGVVIGKSNLYNAVGKFGTNMFHKEGAVSLACWKGDDGTYLEFKSDPANGARDNSITDAKVIASGADYSASSTCKPSKKVSSSLQLLGISMSDSIADLEKKLGAPTEKTPSEMLWHYVSGTPAKGAKSDVEVALANEKITSIRISRGGSVH